MTSAHGGEGSPSMMAAEEPDDRSGRKFELRLNSEELFTEEFKEGDILEVLDLEGVAEDGILRGVFWVEAVELADRSGVTLRVACLGGDGKSETALLGTTFNRKKVRLHLCSGREKDTPCTVGATMAHAQTFYKYPLTDYPLKYVSEEVAKAYKRRRREWDRKRGKGGRDRSESPSRGRRGAGEENPPVRPSALRRKRKESEPPIGQEAERADPESHWRAPGGQGDEEAEEHGEPKERTSREGGHTTRTRQSSNAALSHALGNLRRRLGIEKAPEQRDGVGNGGERSGDFKAAEGALGRAKTRASREPIPVEPIEDEGEATKGTTMSSLKKVQTEKKDRPPRGVLSELVNKAAKRPKEKKEERKESKSTKTAMALVQTLARGLGVKKLPKKASGELRKRKKSRGGADPEESSEGKRSKSSLTKSSESGSENTSGEDIEKVEMEKATPPLERMSQKKKGSVLRLFVQHMRESLQNLDEGEMVEPESVVGGVSAIKYWHLIVKPQMTGRMKEAREVYCLLQALDLLRGGHLDQMGDLLAARIMAIHQSVSDGGSWRAAKHLEIKPLETTSASKTSVVLQARKFAKIADRAQGIQPMRWSPYGKGGRAWHDEEYGGADGRGKGKRKKGKGKGKAKGGAKDWRESQEPPPGKAES